MKTFEFIMNRDMNIRILKYGGNESQNVFFLIHYQSEDISGKAGVQRFILKTTVFLVKTGEVTVLVNILFLINLYYYLY